MNLYPEYTLSFTKAMDDSSSQHVCSRCIETLVLQLTDTGLFTICLSRGTQATKRFSYSRTTSTRQRVLQPSQFCRLSFEQDRKGEGTTVESSLEWPRRSTRRWKVDCRVSYEVYLWQHKSWRLLNVDGRLAWAGMHAWLF